MTETELRDNLDADDGYQVVVNDNRPLSVTVYGEPFAKGRSAAQGAEQSVLLWEARADDARAFGHAQRVQHLADAVFRFMNTGGTAAELSDAMKKIAKVIGGPLTLPDGYFLLETYLNTDNYYEHVFVSPTQDEAVVWVEKGFVDLVPWQTIAERLAENGRHDSATYLEHLANTWTEEARPALPPVRNRLDTPAAGPAG